ncbi:hypothetical protein [Bounagaea algeriensis]
MRRRQPGAPAGRWDALAGMKREKGVIERRVVLPISHPEQAERHGVLPPQAITEFEQDIDTYTRL